MTCVDDQPCAVRDSGRCLTRLKFAFEIAPAERGGERPSIYFDTVGSCVLDPLDCRRIGIHEQTSPAAGGLQPVDDGAKKRSFVAPQIPAFVRSKYFRRIGHKGDLFGWNLNNTVEKVVSRPPLDVEFDCRPRTLHELGK